NTKRQYGGGSDTTIKTPKPLAIKSSDNLQALTTAPKLGRQTKKKKKKKKRKKMGRAEKEQLNKTLNSHLSTIHETSQVLDQSPASSLDKVSWEEVIKMGDQVSKQATMGILLSIL
ncbi:hypothetical protein CFP56_039380, partial [Quercus suber]